MKLGVFLAIGESFADFAKKGQDDLMIRQNLTSYARSFKEVIVFSYGHEYFRPIKNVIVLPNRWNIHRYLYALLMPLLYRSEINSCQVIRGFQLSSGIPGIIARLLGKPVIINYGYLYSDFAFKEGKPIRGLLYKFLEPIVLHYASIVIVTTKELLKALANSWRSKIVYIPNGVDTKLFKPGKFRIFRRFTIIYVGRLEPIKNLSNLVHGVSRISGKVNLILIGSGSEKQNLTSLAKSLAVELHIHDPVPNRKIAELLRRCSVFVLPSLAEGHPKALLEAMSSGLPVVGTRVAGIRELIRHGENGLLCDTDPESIAAALKKIQKNERLASILGESARRTVEENFRLSQTLLAESIILKKLARLSAL